MALPPERIYRKTDTGQAALATRTAALTARLRTALILVNGREPLALLGSKVGPDAVALIETLLGLGLVEEVPPAARPRPVAAPAVAAVPVPPVATPVPPAPPPPALPPEEVMAILAPLKREAIRRLAPQFGPDVDVVCAALLATTTVAAYRGALGGIEAKLAIYLGRAQARRMLDGLWP